MKPLSTYLFAGALAATPVGACDLCAIYNVSAAQGTHDRGVFAGVAEQLTHFATLQNEGKAIHDPARQRLDSSITQIVGGYNFNDWSGAQLNVPLIYRSFRRPEEFGIDNGSESGLGDISVMFNAVPYRHEGMHSTFLWTVSGGIKFPTGSTRRLREELNEDHHDDGGAGEHEHGPESGVHGHDLALGSGSVDGLLGTGFFVRYRRAFFSGAVQCTLRTEGDYDYRYANDLLWNAGPGAFVIFEEEHSLALQLVASGEDKGMDRLDGTRAEDTAITSVFLGPQLNFTWRDKLSAQAGVDVPLLLDNSAVQLVPDWRVRAAITWRF